MGLFTWEPVRFRILAARESGACESSLRAPEYLLSDRKTSLLCDENGRSGLFLSFIGTVNRSSCFFTRSALASISSGLVSGSSLGSNIRKDRTVFFQSSLSQPIIWMTRSS